MKAWTIRGIAASVAAAAASVAMLLIPAGASASCSGANITGQGAAQESGAQALWTSAFNAKCSGTEQVTYTTSSAGLGLASWWVGHNASKYKGFGAGNAFVGTGQPPNPGQESEILEKGSGKVLTIPVLQSAIALPLHLPEGCTATSGKKKKLIHRLVLSDAQAEGIWTHAIKTWAELVNPTNDYNEDKLVGTECKAETPITRVVRAEGAGIVAILDKFLFEINKSPVDGSETWNQLAEQAENIHWPAESEALLHVAKASGVVKKVVETAGSIGEIDLFEARATEALTPKGGGGEGTAIFWPPIQSKKTKFEDPSSNGEENSPASSNCAGELYISLNGVGKQAKFPPSSTEDTWNEVVASTTQKNSYPICGFGYVLSLTKFSAFSEAPSNETSAAEVETVKDYLNYSLSSGAQTLLSSHDFLGVPEGKKAGNVLKIAQEGAAKVSF